MRAWRIVPVFHSHRTRFGYVPAKFRAEIFNDSIRVTQEVDLRLRSMAPVSNQSYIGYGTAYIRIYVKQGRLVDNDLCQGEDFLVLCSWLHNTHSRHGMWDMR